MAIRVSDLQGPSLRDASPAELAALAEALSAVGRHLAAETCDSLKSLSTAVLEAHSVWGAIDDRLPHHGLTRAQRRRLDRRYWNTPLVQRRRVWQFIADAITAAFVSTERASHEEIPALAAPWTQATTTGPAPPPVLNRLASLDIAAQAPPRRDASPMTYPAQRAA